ncbi:MAG: adenosylcobinamide-GDP ribazoletransferase [Desulforhopalus sp.]
MALDKFFTAVRFLTVLPVSWGVEKDPDNFNKCLIFFPTVGLLVGITGFVGAKAALLIFPTEVVTVFALVYLAFVSGCLHLDGLADSADGMLSSRPREKCLAIMKDSRTGAMGVVVVVCVMLTKFASLSTLSPERLCLALLIMPLAGRWAILFGMSLLPYARAEGGLGELFYSSSSKKAAFFGFLLLSVLLALLLPTNGLVILFGILLVNLAFVRWCKVRLGGATGDTLGATCELTEMITAVCFTAIL